MVRAGKSERRFLLLIHRLGRWQSDKVCTSFSVKTFEMMIFFKCRSLLLASLAYIPLTYLGGCGTVWRINSSLIPESKLNSMRKEKRKNLLSTTISMITFLLLSKSLIKKRRECSPTIVLELVPSLSEGQGRLCGAEILNNHRCVPERNRLCRFSVLFYIALYAECFSNDVCKKF